ncbi:uncharacterized protein LOC132870351 [Neoarius graeffei]|uniref:uncharacterized protein LOC132870351 n=1 Tax=Neoarius graeffei TaxID=443677 RepID=UPI00298C2BA0|nr:uncharacterized protein LOC132870351 [Neoarius graeffei]XP_060759965.1 uncharacterized protein LOC132870351 [Neoarius graeffei]
MTQLHSSEVVLKNTAEAVIVPLKYGISSLNAVYQALIETDVDPVTGQCSNYNTIRQQIVHAHQNLKRSDQRASSGLKNLDENLERLTEAEGKLERKKSCTETHLENLRTEQASNEELRRKSQAALEQARRNLNSTKQTLCDQESRKNTAEIITGVGLGVMVIPIVGWIAGPVMVIGGAIEMDEAEHAIGVAEEELRNSETDVKKYESKMSEYESKISQTKQDIRQKDKLKPKREGIQKLKKQIESVADFQKKLRRAVHLLGVLSGKTSVAEHQTRRFILHEPVMKVMEDVMKATEQIIGNELLYGNDMPRLINQMKENGQRLVEICASETSSKNNTSLLNLRDLF